MATGEEKIRGRHWENLNGFALCLVKIAHELMHTAKEQKLLRISLMPVSKALDDNGDDECVFITV